VEGTVLKGTDLYWEILDWDMLQKHKIIQTEYIKMGMLDISITGKKKPSKKHQRFPDNQYCAFGTSENPVQ
jgi:hypothetical protein